MVGVRGLWLSLEFGFQGIINNKKYSLNEKKVFYNNI